MDRSDVCAVPHCGERVLCETAGETQSEQGPATGGQVFKNFCVNFIRALRFVRLELADDIVDFGERNWGVERARELVRGESVAEKFEAGLDCVVVVFVRSCKGRRRLGRGEEM